MNELKNQCDEYISVFRELEDAARRLDRGDRIPKDQLSEIDERWASQRNEIVIRFDRAKDISKRYNIPDHYYVLLKREAAARWNPHELAIAITGDEYAQVDDDITRTIIAIQHAPSFGEHLFLKTPREVWQWLDERHLAKWVVVSVLGLVGLAFLRLLGYDLHGLTEFVKAFRGDK